MTPIAPMMKQLYECFVSSEVSDDMLVEAAALFNENYGTWGDNSHRPGSRVRLSPARLREQYLPDSTESSYAKVTVDGVLAGHAFSCRWKHDGKTVCWVTQLVVSKPYRRRRLAYSMLRFLRTDDDAICGIMSSHPAACIAASAAFSSPIEKVSLDFINGNARPVLAASPVPYIREAKLCGTLFDAQDSTGLILGVDTAFFVDHKEPLRVLETVRTSRQWPFGDLPDGHEYLLIVPAKRWRSKSWSRNDSR